MSGFQTSHVPVTSNLTFAGYAPPPPGPIRSYEPRKSRVVFVLLAVFLGAFGGHNFYAGYVKKAVIQLCITLFSCFTGSFISWIWAIVEACMVNRDDDGIAFDERAIDLDAGRAAITLRDAGNSAIAQFCALCFGGTHHYGGELAGLHLRRGLGRAQDLGDGYGIR